MLSERTGNILKSIIKEYIVKAAPVPSQSVAREAGIKVSSATVRNEMAWLEEEGYILRPHTSAGSIPSDKGYRFYVESLENVGLSPAEQRLISHLFHQAQSDVSEWLSLAAELIARMVQNVAIVTVPKSSASKFKHLELVALQDSLALIVLVMHGAKLKQKLINFETIVTQAELTCTIGRRARLRGTLPGWLAFYAQSAGVR
jgi:heat-inducible transcriptional repressor